MVTRLPRTLAIILLFAASRPLLAQWALLATDASAQKRIQWWRDARFGMFIHWGVYSIPARGEWVQWNEQIPRDEYAKLAEQFHPEHFSAEAWAQIAKDAGMKYMVLTGCATMMGLLCSTIPEAISPR